MPRRSTWLWILLLAAVGVGGLRVWELVSGFGGPSALLHALGSIPDSRDPSAADDQPGLREPAPRSFSAPASVRPPADDPWPHVTYAADEAKDPLTNLLLVQKASPAVAPATQTAASEISTNPEAAAQIPPTPKIQGLMWGGRRPQAVIDGHVYSIGDTVQGTRILAIDRTGITGEFQGRQIRWAVQSAGN